MTRFLRLDPGVEILLRYNVARCLELFPRLNDHVVRSFKASVLFLLAPGEVPNNDALDLWDLRQDLLDLLKIVYVWSRYEEQAEAAVLWSAIQVHPP